MSTLKFSSWQDLNGNEVANSTYPPGLVLVKSQTIGSGVSSVTVTDAFSSTFDNYRIVFHNDTCSVNNTTVWLQLSGASTAYYGRMELVLYTGAVNVDYYNNASNLGIGVTSTTTGASGRSLDVFGPNLARHTPMVGAHYGNGYVGTFQGSHANSTVHTGFSVFPNSGTMTGGTIKVYGYNNG